MKKVEKKTSKKSLSAMRLVLISLVSFLLSIYFAPKVVEEKYWLSDILNIRTFTEIAASTTISSSTTTPFYPNQRAICRDGANNIHVVWGSSSSTISYANSTDNGVTWTVSNTKINSTGTKVAPSISCSGSNIWVSYSNSSGSTLHASYWNSSDNGATWTNLWKQTSSGSYTSHVIVIGSRVYIFWLQTSDIYVAVSTDSGSTFGSAVKIFDTASVEDEEGCTDTTTYGTSYAVSVNGTGTSSDRLFVVARKQFTDQYWGIINCLTNPITYGMAFKNSSDGGATFGDERTILGLQSNDFSGLVSINNNVTEIFTTYELPVNKLYFSNSTNGGLTWTTPYQISIGTNSSLYSPIALNGTNPIVFWENNTKKQSIFSRSFNGQAWDDVINQTPNTNNTYVNAKADYSGNCMEFVYRNTSDGTNYNITYQAIGSCTAPGPTYSLNSTNSTTAGTPVEHRLKWTDNVGLSGYIFQFCNGTWNGTYCLGSTSNWLSGWSYRKNHTITNSTGADVNYTVSITVINATGTDSGNVVYINSTGNTKTRSDFGDIRFTNSTSSLLNYWMETVNNGVNATFWVQVDGNLTSTNQTIYIYYGNSAATNVSNGTKTFMFFDHFEGSSLDTNYWNVTVGPTPTVASSEVQLGEGLVDAYNYIGTKNLDGVTSGKEVRAKLRIVQVSTSHGTQTYSLGCGNSGDAYYNSAGWYYGYGIYMSLNGNGDFGSATNPSVGNYTSYFRVQSDRDKFHAEGPVTVDREKTGSPTFQSNKIGLSTGWDGKVYFDWVFERKFVSLEPAHSIWGSEETQGWANDTWQSMTGTSSWSNVTKVVNSTAGANIAWCVYANDTSNNWNGTSCQTPFSYTTTYPRLLVTLSTPSPSTCTASNPCKWTQNNTYSVQASVECLNGPCGNVNGTVRYNASSANPDTAINTTVGATPFYIVSSSGGITGLNSTVVTATSLHTGSAFQRKTFYDGNKFWVFYNDINSQTINYSYSYDGTSWTSSGFIPRFDNTLFDVYRFGNTVAVGFSNTSKKYFFINGTISGTSITWSSINTITSNINWALQAMSITRSTTGVWFAGVDWDSDGTTAWKWSVFNSTDGITWVSTYNSSATGSGYQDTTRVLPTSNGGIMFVYNTYYSSNIFWANYSTQTGWTSQQSQNFDFKISQYKFEGISLTVDSSDTVHVLYLNSSNNLYYRRYNGSWSDATQIDTGLTQRRASPTISVDSRKNLYAFWNKTNIIYYKKYDVNSGWDSSASTPFGTSFNSPFAITSESNANDKISVVWTEGYNLTTGFGTSVNHSYISSGYSNPSSCGLMSNGETCTLTWVVNATGNISTYWKIDVNFISSESSVSSNATSAATIKIASLPNIRINGIALYYYTGERVNGNVTVIPVESPADKETSTVSNGEWYTNFNMDTGNLQYLTVIIDDNQKLGYNELKLDNPVTVSLNCSVQNIYLSGYSIDLNSGNAITSGSVRLSILDTDYTNTTNFTGNWNINLHLCLPSGKIYTIQILVSDNTGKRGEILQKYPAK